MIKADNVKGDDTAAAADVKSRQNHTEQSAESSKSQIRLYTLTTCSHCKAMREYLTERGIDFLATDVDLLQGAQRKKMLAEVAGYNPRRSFPTALVGQRVLVGFKEDEFAEALQKLNSSSGKNGEVL